MKAFVVYVPTLSTLYISMVDFFSIEVLNNGKYPKDGYEWQSRTIFCEIVFQSLMDGMWYILLLFK